MVHIKNARKGGQRHHVNEERRNVIYKFNCLEFELVDIQYINPVIKLVKWNGKPKQLTQDNDNTTICSEDICQCAK